MHVTVPVFTACSVKLQLSTGTCDCCRPRPLLAQYVPLATRGTHQPGVDDGEEQRQQGPIQHVDLEPETRGQGGSHGGRQASAVDLTPPLNTMD